MHKLFDYLFLKVFFAFKELVDQILDSERKTVRNCSFPGFFPRELNNFPEQLEATTILRRVTNAQEFSVREMSQHY